ncbi:unnamed protein product [Aphanomyces euteiches]
MQTGSGVSHQEKVGANAELFQIWFEPELSQAVKRQPTYRQHEHEDFPQASNEAGYTVKTVIGSGAPVELVTDVKMWDVEVNNGSTYQQKVAAGYTLTALAIRGQGTWAESGEAKQPLDFHHKDFIIGAAAADTEFVITSTGEGSLRLILIEVPTTVDYPLYHKSFWENRLASFGIATTTISRFSEQYLQFTDKEGLGLEIVERADGAKSTWSFGGITPNEAIKGFGGAVLFSTNPAKTIDAVENLLGFRKVGEDGTYVRLQSTGEIGNVIDIPLAAVERGSDGAGAVHHIAWRAADFEQHLEWRSAAETYGYHPTPVIDRQYFNAIYFREAGGILFEIATDPPGFANDEPADSLGEKLMLPEWYEPHRAEIEANLQPIKVRVLEGNQA